MENHLIIGLGGTGGNIIKAFRKRVYEEFGTNKIPNGKVGDVCVSYMWVDSSTRDMDEKQSWRTLGKSVALDAGDKVKINGASASILNRIDDYPGINAWIGDQKIWSKIKGGITDDTGGQRRRLGKLLFAWNIDDFKYKLLTHMENMRNISKSEEITFHICAGLAGGTGSGSIVDVVAQIRDMPETHDCRIVIYAKLPETATMPPMNWASSLGYYRPNGYAALLELNALSVKEYKPYDVSGRKDSRTGKVRRLLTDRGMDAFNCAYVFSNVNVDGGVIDVAGGGLFEVVADFLFYKIVTSKRVGNIKLQSVEQNENEQVEAEDGVRSNRFMSFGISRIEYPDQEIREYIQYSFEKQAVLQFKYNNWSDLGFIEKPEDEIGLGYAAELRNDRNGKFPEWRIDEEHLMLSQKIVDDNYSQWLPFNEDWEKVSQYKQLVKDKDKADWLTELENLCAKRYKEGWRSSGVQEFFRNQKEEMKGYASHIRGLIEQDLFKDWDNGDKSIIEVEKYLRILLEVNESRIEKFGEKQQKKRLDLKDKIEPKILENREAWNRIGAWSNMMGKHEKILNVHSELMKKKYCAMTEVAGYDYAQQLLRRINDQLRELRDTVCELKRRMTDYLDMLDVAISSRCKSGESTTIGESTITFKMYEPDKVRSRTKNYIRDDKLNKENAMNVRKKMIEEIHDDHPDFTKMVKRCDMTVLVNAFDSICGDTAQALIEREKEKGGKVNILERIASQYGYDEEGLGNFIEDKIRLSGVLVKKNAEEISAGSDKRTFKIFNVLFLPEYEDPLNFREKFQEKFESIAGHCEVAKNYKSNEIIILSITSGIPLRFIKDVDVLHREYEAKISEPGGVQHKLLLHGEGDGSQFPSLYPEKFNEEKREEFAPYLIIAMALGIVQFGYLHDGSGKRVYFYTDSGKEYSLHCQTFRNAVENIDEETAYKIQELTLTKLGTADYLSKTKRTEVKNIMDKDISEAVKKECGRNREDWNRFVEAKNNAAGILDEHDKDRMTD